MATEIEIKSENAEIIVGANVNENCDAQQEEMIVAENVENVNEEQNNEEEELKDEPMEQETILNVENIENPDVNKLKEIQRRRSLRNEQANGVKKKPPKYDEIFNCYKRKEYKECVIYIDLVADNACMEYQVLKATCLANIGGVKLPEAHRILDECLKQRPDNTYCLYAKGLAYFQDCRWKDSIEYFSKAIALDEPSMQRAEVLRKLAQENLDNEKAEEGYEEEEAEVEMEVDSISTADASQDSDDPTNKRFGCELCMKYFCKKFNLDRHNKTFHNRETPPIPPLPRNRHSLPAESKVKKEKNDEDLVSIKEENFEPDDEDYTPTSSGTKKRPTIKIRAFKSSSKSPESTKSKSTILKNGLAKCNICKKVYTKGSLARHQIIHTGQKQFKCEECGKAFYQKSDLERHVTIHSDVFDFECEQCDKKFRIKKNLQVHIKRHHTK